MTNLLLDPDNARIWGSDDDYVAIADVDTAFTAPTKISGVPPNGFEAAGWLGPDGLTLTPTDEIQKLKGFQGGRVIRVVNTSSENTFTFIALESKVLTLGLALDLEESTLAGDITKHKFPGSRGVKEKQVIAATFDGDVKWLWHFPKAAVTEKQEITFGREEITAYQVTVEVLGDYFLYTEDDPGMAGEG